MLNQEEKSSKVPANIYKHIDQAYAWALAGMEFVASLKMEDCLTLEICRSMIKKFDDYMEKHPPPSEEEFQMIEESCHQHGNTKCLRQCNLARQKCKEIISLFKKRRELLDKVKGQIKAANKKKIKENKENNLLSSVNQQRQGQNNHLLENSHDEKREPSTLNHCLAHDTISLSPSSQSPLSIEPCATSKYHELTEIGRASKSNHKPARKILKKSSSAPIHHVTQQVMSHHHSQSGVTLTIGLPVHLESDADFSGKSKVDLIIEELIATEREYVRSLNYVVENYFPEMCRLDIPQALRCKRNIIFGNIEKIFQFHSHYFLRDLESCHENPLRVAKAFQIHKESFGLYALYSKNKPQSDQLLYEYGNDFFKAKQIELGDKMDLASYLLKPVQRMGKYALLLRAMSKECSNEEQAPLRDAEELVKFQLRHGNDLLTMDSIQYCDVNLKEQGNLLRQDQFIIFSGRRKIIRRVFLFEDLILLSKPLPTQSGHDIYQYKCSYKTAEIGLTENIGDSGYKFEIWFRRRRAQATHDRFVLQSTSRSTKRAWVEEIRGLLWKQAVKNKSHRKVEMSSMGVGSKPHLDLANLSQDRITDRSVVMLQHCEGNLLADRLAKSRMRSSVAVSQFNSEQYKRPYSIISSASSSSSVGSGSLLSSLFLASWPPKSDSKQTTTILSPPIAYRDFHAIVETSHEESESTTTSSTSSISESERKTQISRHYSSPNNLQQLIMT